MAQYEIRDGKRVLVSRTQPANAKRTASSTPPRPTAESPAKASAPKEPKTPKTAGKATAKED